MGNFSRLCEFPQPFTTQPHGKQQPVGEDTSGPAPPPPLTVRLSHQVHSAPCTKVRQEVLCSEGPSGSLGTPACLLGPAAVSRGGAVQGGSCSCPLRPSALGMPDSIRVNLFQENLQSLTFVHTIRGTHLSFIFLKYFCWKGRSTEQIVLSPASPVPKQPQRPELS